MASYIEAAVLGRLGGAVMQRHTNAGKGFVTLSLAVQVPGAEAAEWVQISIFEPLLAELPEGLVSGERCYAEGPIRVNRWTGKDGETRANLQIAARKFEALDRIGRRAKRRKVKAEKTNGEAPAAIPPSDRLIPF